MIEASGLVLALTTEANAQAPNSSLRPCWSAISWPVSAIHPVQSFYRWEGELQASHEVQLLMKTSAQHVDALRLAVSDLHSYDTPEWLCWPVTASPAYGAWAIAELSSDASPPAA